MAASHRRILFVHQNYPGQFRHLAPRLARQGLEVVALRQGPNEQQPPEPQLIQGLRAAATPWLEP